MADSILDRNADKPIFCERKRFERSSRAYLETAAAYPRRREHPGFDRAVFVVATTLVALLSAVAFAAGCAPVENEALPIDETLVDDDGDGYSEEGSPGGDCDDENALTYPGAAETCDGVDENCDGSVDDGFDQDGDGYKDIDACLDVGGDDCDDANLEVYPSADEVCDFVDNDCNGSVDEGYDGDGDGHTSCDEEGNDCSDEVAEMYPGAREVCDGIDNDCDGKSDEGYIDNRSDTPECIDDDGDGYTEDDGDCNDAPRDSNADDIYPGATEVCNGRDDDCDNRTDEGVTNTYYIDRDDDGYGDASSAETACNAPSGYVSDNTDCDDSNQNVNPDADERCNGSDDNCDGIADEGLDADGDGYGACEGVDCDDSDPQVNVAAEETCNDIDDDCNGDVDEGFDDDLDGVKTCEGDCDDASAASYPGADEICDGLDNDCDEFLPDEEVDGDGDGSPFCADCDDDDDALNPDYVDTCDDEIDNDCDGESGEDTTEQLDIEPNDDMEHAQYLGVLDESPSTETCTTIEGQLVDATDIDYFGVDTIDQLTDDWAISAQIYVPEGLTYCVDILDGDPDDPMETACATGPEDAMARIDFVPYSATLLFWIKIYPVGDGSCAPYTLTACGY